MKNETNLEVLEVDAEEIPLEEKIENELQKSNVTDAVINAMKEKYGSLRLERIDDKNGYLEIKNARKEVRKIGILTETLCKKGRESAIREQRLWLDKQKEILDKINKVQLPLEAEIEKFESEVAKKEKEEQELKEKVFQERQATIIKLGAAYNNGQFVLNHIEYEIGNIREAEQDVWEEIILPKYKTEFEKNEAEKARIEKEREAAALKLKQEQEELNRQREEMERQKKELTEAQSAMQKAKDDAEREKRFIRQEEEDRLFREQRDRVEKRYDQLSLLGMKYNGRREAFIFEDIDVDNSSINILDEEGWAELISRTTQKIEERKEVIDAKRIADAEAKRQADIEAALKKERERVAKEKADAELKAKQAEMLRQEKLEQAKDKEKWELFIEAIKKLETFDMRSGQYRKRMQIAKEKLSEIIEL